MNAAASVLSLIPDLRCSKQEQIITEGSYALNVNPEVDAVESANQHWDRSPNLDSFSRVSRGTQSQC